MGNTFQDTIRRPASILELGGQRPPSDPMHSWFGKVSFCEPGEGWPMQDGVPMEALAQINVASLLFTPPELEDVEFIAIFINSKELPYEQPNGVNWALRAYKDISKLVPLEQRHTETAIKSFPMFARSVTEDFPSWEDCVESIPDEFEENYDEKFPTSEGFKIGGWPFLVQSEIYWAPHNKHPASPRYVFQIDSTDKGNWGWGDGGIGYFGRGTTEGHRDEWFLEWQCY